MTLDEQKVDLVNKMIALTAKQAELKVLQDAAAELAGNIAVKAKAVEVQAAYKAVEDLRKILVG